MLYYLLSFASNKYLCNVSFYVAKQYNTRLLDIDETQIDKFIRIYTIAISQSYLDFYSWPFSQLSKFIQVYLKF